MSVERHTEILTTQAKEQWASGLVERAKSRGSFFEIDGRNGLPDYLSERLTKPDIDRFRQFLGEHFTEQDLSSLEGKTFAVPYVKWGHGHKHQALDFSLALASTLKSRVIFYDPMDALPDRERNVMDLKKDLHKMLQFRNPAILQDLKKQLEDKQYSDGIVGLADKFNDRLAYLLADLALRAMPGQDITVGGQEVSKKGFSNWLFQKLIDNPLIGVRAVALTEMLWTERSVSCAAVSIAAQYGADAIITTHPYTIRSFTPDNLHVWLPKSQHDAARRALGTVMTLIPDTGYDFRSLDPQEEAHPKPDQKLEGMLLTEPFAFPPKPFGKKIPWFTNALHVVADEKIASSFHEYWNIQPDKLVPLGTIGDTITKDHFDTKWSGKDRHILLASNGNGSNIRDAERAILDIGRRGKEWITDGNYHLDIYLATFGDRKDGLLRLLEDHHLAEHAEVIDYDRDFFNNGNILTLDQSKRIHIAFARTDVSGSELKQLMQREAHVEIRSAGENALTGAKVGALELLTPPGGPNEIYNSIWAYREKVGYPVGWPPEADGSNYWAKAGFTLERGAAAPIFSTFTDLVDYYLGLGRPGEQYAREAFTKIDKHMIYATIGVLIRELLERSGTNVPEQGVWIKKVRDYQAIENAKDRNA